MQLEPSALLRTRVARRMLLLFLVGAVLPVGVLSLVVYTLVSSEFNRQTDDHLRMAADLSAQALLGRLRGADTELRALARQAHDPSNGEIGGHVDPEGAFARVTIAAVDDTPVAQGGVASLSEEERARLRAGSSLLRLENRAGGTTEILLGVPDSARRTVLWGKLNARYLWSTGADDIGLAGGPSCVFAGGTVRTLHCDEDNTTPLGQSLRGIEHPSGTVRLNWQASGEQYAGMAEQVFLRAGYGTDSWWIVVGVNRAEAAGRIAAFTRTFAITIALAIVIAFLLSNVQIRRNLAPLARLTAATTRLGDGDFTHRVEVKTNDEFGDLAKSFNRMTSDLQEHFALLRAMTAIDRASLEGRGPEQVANAVAQQCLELFQTDRMVIGFAGLEPEEPWTMVAVRPSVARHTARLLAPGPGDLDLLASDTPFWYFDDSTTSSMFLTNGPEPESGPRLIVPLRQGTELLGYLALSQPRAPGVVPDDAIPEQLVRQIEMGVANGRAVERLERLTFSTLETLARTIDANSPWTAGHSERVTKFSLRLGRELNLASDDLTTLHRGGLLHDIGKIAVPATILDSPYPLTDTELAVVRSHPVVGARILEPIRAYSAALPIVLHHHERINGSGYPHGLAGDAIPYLARITAIADVYDALTSNRPYRGGWNQPDAIAYLREGAGVHFDSGVVAALTRLTQRREWDEPAAAPKPLAVS